MSRYEQQFLRFLDSPWNVAYAALAGVAVLFVLTLLIAYPKHVVLVLKSLGRNKVRTGLTALATMVMVLVLTLVWSVLSLLSQVTEDKSKDLKAIVTEKWQIPSQMPYSYASSLSEGAPREAGDYRVADRDGMTWQFFGGSIEQ